MRRVAPIFACALSAGCAPASTLTVAPPIVEVGASQPGVVESTSARAPLVLGAYLSLTGSDAEYGSGARRGIDLAVEEVNAAGGVHGRMLRVSYADDGSELGRTAEVVTRLLAEEHVVALLGEIASSRSAAGGAVATEHKVPMLTPASTNPALLDGSSRWLFRACFDDAQQGKAAADYLVRDLRKTRLGLLSLSGDMYSQILGDSFKSEALRIGGQVVVEQTFSQTEQDPRRQLGALAAAQPEAIFAPVYYTRMIGVAHHLKGMALRPESFLGADGWAGDALLREAGSELEGAHFLDQWAPDAPWPEAASFRARYRERYGAPPSPLSALAYDALRLLADAAARAAGEDSSSIRDALARTAGFHGATGEIGFGDDLRTEKAVVVRRIAGGAFHYDAIVR